MSWPDLRPIRIQAVPLTPARAVHSCARRQARLPSLLPDTRAANPAHGGISPQTAGIVHIIVSAKPAKDRLTELPRHAVPSVLACTVVAENIPGHLGKFESVIEFSIGKKTSVRGDLGAVELQLQAAVKIDPKAPLFRFTHRVRHDYLAQSVSTI